MTHETNTIEEQFLEVITIAVIKKVEEKIGKREEYKELHNEVKEVIRVQCQAFSDDIDN